VAKAKDVVDEQEAPDEMAALLQQAAAQLAAAATDRENRSAALKDVEATLSKINLKDFPELAESPIVQAFLRAMGGEDLAPGEVRNRGTLAEREREWSPQDMARFPIKTFEPRETIPVTFNGLTYQLIDGQEVTVPEPIYTIYQEHRRALVEGKKHEEYLLGYSSVPPDPNWVAESSAKVRAFSQMGPTPDARKRGVGFIATESEGESA
jgi:hypothetical protein